MENLLGVVALAVLKEPDFVLAGVLVDAVRDCAGFAFAGADVDLFASGFVFLAISY